MNLPAFSGFIRCTFDSEKEAGSVVMPHKTELFFAHKNDFSSGYKLLEKFSHPDDQLKVERLRKRDDFTTTLACHTLLRLLLSEKLKIKPGNISYFTTSRGKPVIRNSPLQFNISHSKDAFVIAISDGVRVGADLEEHRKSLNYESVVKRFFSEAEAEYILNPSEGSSDRFFLLWTRKEALLKAIGTGIISELANVEVFRHLNLMDRKSIDPNCNFSVSNDYYIYSAKHTDYHISVALTQQSDITFHHLNEENVKDMFL